jgi:agmatinase
MPVDANEAHDASGAEPPRRGDLSFLRSDLRGVEPENTYAGVLSFMRRRYTRELTGADVVVTGIPLDIATTFRPGARLGPAAVRAASVQLNERLFPWGFNPCERLSVIDYGDCWLDHHRPATVAPTITEHARTIVNSGATMLSLGGDHFITYPLLKAHVERHGQPLALVHFDAHCDTWPDDAPDSLNHGSMFYKAVRDGLVDVKRSVQIGIRTWNDDFMGIEVLGADWVHGQGTKAVAERVRSIVGDHPAYLTFDIDCLDPAFAPGTGTPVPGGLSSAQALDILRGFVPLNIVGMDVVEVAPAYDHSEITALAAAHIAAEMLCVLSEHRR